MRRQDFDYPHGDIPRIPLELIAYRDRYDRWLVVGIWIAIAVLCAQVLL